MKRSTVTQVLWAMLLCSYESVVLLVLFQDVMLRGESNALSGDVLGGLLVAPITLVGVLAVNGILAFFGLPNGFWLVILLCGTVFCANFFVIRWVATRMKED